MKGMILWKGMRKDRRIKTDFEKPGHNLSAEGRSRKKISGELAASEKKEIRTVSVQRKDKEITS